MEERVFAAMATAYFEAAENLFSYSSEIFWLFRPLFWIVSIFYGAFLLVCGVFFFILIIFDYCGKLVDRIRMFIFDSMRDAAEATNDSFFTFLFFPIWVALLAPFFLLSLLIPKLSSEKDYFETGDFFVAIFSGGCFGKTGRILLVTCKNTFSFLDYIHWLFKPIVLVIAILYSMVLLLLAACFYLLVPLDWISSLLDRIRRGVIGISEWLAESVEENFFGYALSPIVMVCLSPLFLFILIIPKFSGTPMDLDVS